ncbi:DMT family transporter [Parvularcula sp. IMCC14364]|uniref:DMT family transporter n=1 Tax=Parvularcula sp. IMCC14364 TaxID=3067902 RepID=UPI002741A1E2|nr:DMT family transporter [Parvularcula sp. IMCC14364]
MSTEVIAALCMIASALGHAVMNVYNKGADDIVLFRAVFLGISATCSIPFLFFLPFPTFEVWMHLGFSLVIHAAYTFFMLNALQKGDLGLVYPIMRGLAPVLAALIALFFLGEELPLLAVLGLIAACATLIAFAWPAKGGTLNKTAIIYALLTAIMIAFYSVNDAAGARAMGNPLVYIAWFFVSVSLPIALTCFWLRRKVFVKEAPGIVRKAFLASLVGFSSYALALYALSLAPVALMVSLRETSVVFGAILATVILKEPFGQRRILLAGLLAFFLVLMQVTAN